MSGQTCNYSARPPGASSARLPPLVQSAGQGDGAEAQVGALALQEPVDAHGKGLGAQDVVVGVEVAAAERALAAAVELPQAVVGAADEADVVQVDVVAGVGGGRVTGGGGLGVGGGQGGRGLEQGGAGVGLEGDRVAQQAVERRRRLCADLRAGVGGNTRVRPRGKGDDEEDEESDGRRQPTTAAYR